MNRTRILSSCPKPPIQECGERRVADLLSAAEQLYDDELHHD
jgi:hypothetical protein